MASYKEGSAMTLRCTENLLSSESRTRSVDTAVCHIYQDTGVTIVQQPI